MFRRAVTWFRSFIYELLWFLALFVFGWTYQAYVDFNKFVVRQKENVVSLYHRNIYKELRFFFS